MMGTLMCGASRCGRWHRYACDNKAVVTIDGKSYCGVHHPDTVARRKVKQREKEAAKRVASDERWVEENRKRDLLAACERAGIQNADDFYAFIHNE